MSFKVFATGTIANDISSKPPIFMLHEFNGISEFEIHPPGALVVDENGEGDMWIFAPGGVEMATANGHLLGEISWDVSGS